MIRFGLIGKKLKHSFSADYFQKKFEAAGLHEHAYELFELDRIGDIGQLVADRQLKGFNVTIPYKQTVIEYLDELSPEAKAIGAVNCVSVVNGRLKGYNTDAYGFAQSVKPFLDNNHQRALILGTGGSSRAVAWALKNTGVEVFFVTSGKVKTSPATFFYSEINEIVMNSFRLIINTTPLGMFPETGIFPPLPYHFFTPGHFAYDLIYNPPKTLFLKRAEEHGATIMNGLSMLKLQAEKSWEIWEQEQGRSLKK